MAGTDTNHDQLITQFCELTGSAPTEAQQFLIANRWDLSSAATEYYTAQEEGTAVAEEGAERAAAPEEPPYTGPRTLDGRPAPESSMPGPSSSRRAPPPRRGGIATLGSINQAPAAVPHHGHGHAHLDDDSDDDEEENENGPRDLFAGGEKSGLAVQDPNSRNDPKKVVKDILKKARANAARPGGEEPAPVRQTRFRGSGQTLGDDDTPSQFVPNPHPQAPAEVPNLTRILHLWEDGFSIEDGELRRFDDPQNAADLQMIRQGRAPLHLMGVRPDQPIDVQLVKHDENYKAPPKVYKPFSGGGQRLGSPTPGGPSIAAAPTPATPAFSTAPEPQEVDIDSSQPTLSLRIQLADGTRLPARFNTTHTIGDVYDFISRAYPASSARSWVLATTFPNKDHTDKSAVLGEMAEFKRGGTAVQKWT